VGEGRIGGAGLGVGGGEVGAQELADRLCKLRGCSQGWAGMWECGYWSAAARGLLGYRGLIDRLSWAMGQGTGGCSDSRMTRSFGSRRLDRG